MTAAIAPIASNGPAAAKAAGPSATPASPLSSAMAKHRQELGTLATTLPFFAYTACFLLAPTVIVIVGAFQDRSGNFTLANFNKMFEANTIAAFGTSILVSLASSLIGAVVGALASYALVIGAKPNGLLRRMVSAISSVLAQFGGVMLAFAFIATIGINGIGTMLIKTLTGYTVNPNWLSSLPGLVTIYCYFQIPLMIIIFLPAVDSIRPQWREACESLGGNTSSTGRAWPARFWHPASSPRSCCFRLRVLRIRDRRGPVLPAFDSGAAYDPRCHAQRTGPQPAGLCPGAGIRNDHRRGHRHAVEPRRGKEGRTLAMTETSATKPPQLRAARARKQSIIKFVILFVTLAFLFVPLLAMLIFTLRHPLSGRWSAAPWIAIFTGNGESLGADLTVLWQGIGTSLALSAVTVVIMLVLLVPTMVIVHIRSKVLERAIEWVATLPLTIPAIVLVVGLGPIYRWLSADVLSTNPIWLCFAYVILVMPFAFRAIAVGLNSIDVKTLVEASRSLGASWPKVFFKVIIPNLWQSILSASFISIAVVLGEYTVASLLGRMNLQVALYQLGQSNSQICTAMSLLALLFGAVLLVALDLISDAMRKSREGK